VEQVAHSDPRKGLPVDRRRFSRNIIAALGAASIGPWPVSASGRRNPAAPGVDGDRLNGWITELSRFGRRSDGGIDRVAFSDADLEGREYVRALMSEAGLDVTMDPVGNLLGLRAGSDSRLPPLLFGSHIDSVPAGGNFDGPVGSLGAIEVVRALEAAGIQTRHPLEVVVFVNEEGGKTGSRAMAGVLGPGDLDRVTASGFTVGEGIRRLGGDPDRLGAMVRTPGSVAGYLELHIEQGAVLEQEGLEIGVVEGIVGIRRWNAVIRGFANHAGTTPMDQRRDAMLGAADLVHTVNRVALSMPGSQVATVGRIAATPGAPNVIPGEVRLSIEIRDLAMETIQRVFDEIATGATEIAASRDLEIELDEFYLSAAAPSDERFRQWVEAAAEEAGLSHRRMPSGAGHDAQSVAHFAPMGMIFIPSQEGISHSPLEFTRPEHIEAGANVLLGALLRADQSLS